MVSTHLLLPLQVGSFSQSAYVLLWQPPGDLLQSRTAGVLSQGGFLCYLCMFACFLGVAQGYARWHVGQYIVQNITCVS
jgi:hypothetical protein